MMRAATSILALLSVPTLAGDFRLLDFGASCANVAAQEVALGAKEVRPRVEGMGILAFEGEAFDRRLDFTYFCPKGVLFTGDYYFPSQPLSDAVVSYEAAHKQLSTIYGAPVLDNSPWMQPAVDTRWLESNPLKYMTTWNTPRISIATIFLPSLPEQPPGWRVAIHFGQSLDAERSNKSLERTRAE
jgi:hypothetical protein